VDVPNLNFDVCSSILRPRIPAQTLLLLSPQNADPRSAWGDYNMTCELSLVMFLGLLGAQLCRVILII